MTIEHRYGLIPRDQARHRQAIALQGVRVDARVSGSCVEVTVKQRYLNTEKVAIEAVYIFPLDEAAAVCGFSATLGDTLVLGQVEEREKAFARYDDAMMEGDAAFLLDQERPNVFTASVGNLLPGEQVELELRYVARLEREGEALRLTVPTTVSPRYSATAAPQVGQPEAERVNPERQEQVPYGLTLEVLVEGAVREVESPSHPIRARTLQERTQISLSQQDVALDRDFVLLVTPAEVAGVQVAREPDGRRVVLLNFRHDLAAENTGHEVVFLLDCSGSMGGSSIEQAKRALSLCIHALSSEDTFNVLRFGSSHQSLFAKSRRFDQKALDEATAYLENVDADLGGTEILEPLRVILEGKPDENRARRVLLLTDGQVDNEAEVIALARRHAASARVFSFGIGEGVSAHLVRGVARASRAASELIFPGERIEPKVLRMFERVRTPVLDDLRIDWGGLEVEQATRELPPLFAGDELTVLARVVSGSASEITLHAGTASWSAAIDLERAELAGPIPTLWARERIRELEDQAERTGSAQRAERGHEARRAKLVELGVRYQLLSSATSFVAVQVRSAEQRSDRPAELRRIPVALTHGQTAFRTLASASGGMIPVVGAALSAPAPMMARAFGSGAAPKKSRSKAAPRMMSEVMESAAPIDRVYALLMSQRADGSFPFSAPLTEWLGGERAVRLKEAIAREGEHAITFVVILLLEREASDRRSEWQPAVRKARSWLATQSRTFDASTVL